MLFRTQLLRKLSGGFSVDIVQTEKIFVPRLVDMG